MATSSIDLTQLSRHNGQLAQLLGPDLPGIMRRGAERAGARFDGIVRTELPPPVRKLPQAPFWTAKQKRWWWGTMHRKALGKSKELPGWKAVYRIVEGRKTLVISGGYKRTGTLIKTLTYEVKQTAASTDVIYGSNRAYAKYVIDRADQATYHKGNWKTLQTFADESATAVVDAFDDSVQADIARRIG